MATISLPRETYFTSIKLLSLGKVVRCVKNAVNGQLQQKTKLNFKPNRMKSMLILGSLFVLLLFVILLAVSVGPVTVPFKHTLAVIWDAAANSMGQQQYSERDAVVVLNIRLPRVLVGALVGAALGISGAIMQGLFRNPLVEPGFIGVSSGAAVGAVLAIFFGWTQLSKWMLPGSAFAGALIAILVILTIWQASRKSSVSTLLLIGLGMNLFLSAIISVFVASAPNEQDLRGIVFWLQGGLEARTWEHVQLILPFIVVSVIIASFFARELNMMLLGDDQAKSSGVPVNQTRFILLGLAALMTGTGVAVSGTIGFVGLVVPHVIRLLCGPDHRILLPASALGGASFLVLADIVSRMMLHPITLQVGVVCALIGAPVFWLLILRTRRESI